MTEYRDFIDRTEMLRSEDKIRIAFGELGVDDPICRNSLVMALHDNYPLSAALFVALEHIKKERDQLKEVVIDHNMNHITPMRLGDV